jgi:hypothetical protein|tara:strand:- start:6668 stop:7612 length:945 start_codon:yes stop_codon:yes gene_type:complete
MTAGRFPYNHGGVREVTPALHDIGGRPVYGNVYFVDSGNGNAGTTTSDGQKRQPFSTIDAAINVCTANNGDVIYVAPGHAETITTASQIDADVAGISIIGCGNGSNKPTLTYTIAAGEFAVGADNVHIENIRFVSSVTAVLKGIDIEDGVDYCTIKNCEFMVDSANTDEFNAVISLTNNNTGCVIEGCTIDMALGGSVAAIHMDADTANTVIKNNRIHGDYSTACIAGDSTLSTEILIQGNVLQNGDTGGIGTEPCIELLTGTTGLVIGNFLMCNVASDNAALVGDAVVNFANEYSETVGAGVGIGTTTTTVNT